MKLASAAIRSPFAPFVRGVVSLYARHMLASRREVVCKMVTVSSLMEEKSIR